MVRNIGKKLLSVKERLKNLSDAARGCYYCQGNCYQRVAPHLGNLEKWLVQAKKLKAPVFDKELVWIFGRSADAEAMGDSGSDESHESFVSEVTEISDTTSNDGNCNKKRKCSALKSGTPHCKRNMVSTDEESFVSEATADSDADGMALYMEDVQGNSSCSSSHARHEVSTTEEIPPAKSEVFCES